MSWFARWWTVPRSPKKRSTRRSTVHLSLESLEDRSVPTVLYYGGALLPHVEAQAVYYGSSWNSTPYAGQKSTLDTYLSYIVNSPYTQVLTQAGYGVGTGTASAGATDAATLAAGSTVRDSSIQAEIQSLISKGAVAAPDANRLYVVYVSPNVLVQLGNLTSRQGLLGYHGAFAGRTAGGQAIDVHYAVIAYPGGSVANATNSANPIDDLTSVTSHELAEAITDPNVNYKTLGWYDPRLGEIGDITEQYLTRLNGYLVQEVAGKNDLPLALTNVTPPQPPPATPVATTTTLTLSANQITEGQTVNVTITVTPASGSGTVGGVVDLLDGGQLLGKLNLGANGQVTVQLYANLGSAGSHTLTASYEGSSSYQRSTSKGVSLTVSAALNNPGLPWWLSNGRHGP